MGMGLRVEVSGEPAGSDRRFDVRGFPVSFGREDLLNDVTLGYPFVSSYHARVELVGDRLMVRDLGSRNGVTVGSPRWRIPAHEPIDLTPFGNVFAIGTLSVQLWLAKLPEAEGNAPLRSSITGKELQTARDASPEIRARSADTTRLVSELDRELSAYRQAWREAMNALSHRIGGLAPRAAADVLEAIAVRYAEIAHEPEFQQLAEQYGVPVARRREEKRALEALEELSAYFLDQPLRGESDVALFSQKIRRTLETFLTSFVALRDGLRAFEREVVLNEVWRAPHPLDTARTLAQVATVLLDPKQAADGARALRSTFAEIMSHQLSLMAGVMDGVRALLRELSPDAIELALDGKAERHTKRGPVEFGPWKQGAKWREYVMRHRDYAAEESQYFKMVFGRDFAETYLRHFGSHVPLAAHRVDAAEEQAPPAPPEPKPTRADIAKTPETHGAPKPRIGPTGTMLVPRDGSGPSLKRQ